VRTRIEETHAEQLIFPRTPSLATHVTPEPPRRVPHLFRGEEVVFMSRVCIRSLTVAALKDAAIARHYTIARDSLATNRLLNRPSGTHII
jgi:hypothetical protein